MSEPVVNEGKKKDIQEENNKIERPKGRPRKEEPPQEMIKTEVQKKPRTEAQKAAIEALIVKNREKKEKMQKERDEILKKEAKNIPEIKSKSENPSENPTKNPTKQSKKKIIVELDSDTDSDSSQEIVYKYKSKRKDKAPQLQPIIIQQPTPQPVLPPAPIPQPPEPKKEEPKKIPPKTVKTLSFMKQMGWI